MNAAPRCFNRPPVTASQVRYGIDQGTGALIRIELSNAWFVDRCTTHDGRGIGPNGESYPAANGWLPWCAQCRWHPGVGATAEVAP